MARGKYIAAAAAGLAAIAYLASHAGQGSTGSHAGGASQAASRAGGVAMVRDAAVGARYGAPGPRACSSRSAPQSGALSAAEARAYVICDIEGVIGETLILLSNVEVQVSNGRPYNYATDNFQGIANGKLVYDIQGSSVNYTCVTPDLSRADFQPCTRVEDPGATGRCFQDTDADWHCSWTASVSASTDTRLRVPAPEESDAD